MTNPNNKPMANQNGGVEVSRTQIERLMGHTQRIIGFSGLRKEICHDEITNETEHGVLSVKRETRLDRISTVKPVESITPITVGNEQYGSFTPLTLPEGVELPDEGLAIVLFLGDCIKTAASYFWRADNTVLASRLRPDRWKRYAPRLETTEELVEAMASVEKQLEHRVGHVALAA
jgi:hypothetical protein